MILREITDAMKAKQTEAARLGARYALQQAKRVTRKALEQCEPGSERIAVSDALDELIVCMETVEVE